MKNHRTLCCVHDQVKQPCTNLEHCSDNDPFPAAAGQNLRQRSTPQRPDRLGYARIP
jgi:hypothetical protein